VSGKEKRKKLSKKQNENRNQLAVSNTGVATLCGATVVAAKSGAKDAATAIRLCPPVA
jgi:hypothetical protein